MSAVNLSKSNEPGAEAQPARTAAVASKDNVILWCFFMTFLLFDQRLRAGAMDTAPVLLTPRYTPKATVASLAKPGYGKRCWR